LWINSLYVETVLRVRALAGYAAAGLGLESE
jgi:hypothetical protein